MTPEDIKAYCRKYPSGFEWRGSDDKRWECLDLISPDGKKAATVSMRKVVGHDWWVFDENGAVVGISEASTVMIAMTAAESAVLRWGRHAIQPTEQPK